MKAKADSETKLKTRCRNEQRQVPGKVGDLQQGLGMCGEGF